jgi:S-adenosylmethionine-diacylgycerolhomoserine-N-methlytransferase
MDATYAWQRHIYDATRKFFLFGRDRLIETLDVPEGGAVLEVGCGTGRNLIQVARRYPTAQLFGLDISEAMLATARKSVERAGLADRITLKQADATHFDAAALFGHAQFDRVFFSYTLSMIPDWKGALAQGAKVTRGSAHVVDFGQQEGWPGAFKSLLFAWLDSFGVEPRAMLPDYIKTLELQAEFLPLYRGCAWSAILSRELDSGNRSQACGRAAISAHR